MLRSDPVHVVCMDLYVLHALVLVYKHAYSTFRMRIECSVICETVM